MEMPYVATLSQMLISPPAQDRKVARATIALGISEQAVQGA
jgi:hypothetical protein